MNESDKYIRSYLMSGFDKYIKTTDLIDKEFGDYVISDIEAAWDAALGEAIRIAHARNLPYLVRDIERLKSDG